MSVYQHCTWCKTSKTFNWVDTLLLMCSVCKTYHRVEVRAPLAKPSLFLQTLSEDFEEEKDYIMVSKGNVVDEFVIVVHTNELRGNAFEAEVTFVAQGQPSDKVAVIIYNEKKDEYDTLKEVIYEQAARLFNHD